MRVALVTAGVMVASLGAPAGAAAQADDPFGPLREVGVRSVVTTVPVNTYAPDTVPVSRSLGLRYLNLDGAPHDVVALDAKRPDGSAPWCDDYESPDDPAAEDCPLFWSETLDTQGTETEVLGLEDTEVGRSYAFYCTWHPNWMSGKIEVVE